MNVKQAKLISLTGILKQLGHEPVARRSNGDLRYLSPFRDETEPSFDVDPRRNIWHDFAIGGGTVIDFALQYFSCGTVSDALRELERFQGVGNVDASPLPLFPHEPSLSTSALSSFASPKTSGAPTGITLKHVQPLQNRALIQYLDKRAIPAEYARPYVQEAYYSVAGRDRTYFALAFPNLSGGMELRNPYFKCVAGNKDVSLILPDSEELSDIMIFEGFMDFISALVYWKTPAPETAALILNSVALKNKAIAVIRQFDVSNVQLYLDRDDSGRRLTEEFQAIDRMTWLDKSDLYNGYKDFNAFLEEQRQQGRS